MTISNRLHTVEARVPASTANLGAGFDCCGIALNLYLTVRARIAHAPHRACRVRTRGEGVSASLPQDEANLIYRAMRFVAERERLELPDVRLAVCNEIPLASGLGSSGAAIVAGAVLCPALCGRDVSIDALLRHVTAFEGHADNVAAALLGGWVVNCMTPDGDVRAIKRSWTTDIKFVVVTPRLPLSTERARAVLPRVVTLADAVHNLQRASLFNAAIETRRYDLLDEAMRDRLHQPYRRTLAPGLSAALDTKPQPGLLGIALSGAGASVVALAQDDFDRIGASIRREFNAHGVEADVRVLEADEAGARVIRL